MEENQSLEHSLPHGAVVKPDTDFDKSEPRALLIAGLGIGTVVGLVIVLLSVQAYFDHIKAVATYEKVLVPVSEDLKNLHMQEDQELNSYKYLDRNQGIVQIPISRAMQLITEEAAENKLKYFQKSTPVKVPVAAPAAGTAAPAAAGPAANGAASAPNAGSAAAPAVGSPSEGSPAPATGQKSGSGSASGSKKMQ
jgi:hypothetical protein